MGRSPRRVQQAVTVEQATGRAQDWSGWFMEHLRECADCTEVAGPSGTQMERVGHLTYPPHASCPYCFGV